MSVTERSRMAEAPIVERQSYYGHPIIKEPVWSEEIAEYFFFGGLAGASATLGWAAGVAGNDELARSAWATAVGGVGVSAPLLIADLGRPERFLHMLRVFKVTSPMSVGTWILSASGVAFSLGFVRAWLHRFERAGAVAAPIAGAALGPALCTYTAVLVADTAVPVWHEARRFLPFVFAGSAMSAAGGASCILTSAANAGPARRMAITGATIETAAALAMDRHLEELGTPYRAGAGGRYHRAARILSAIAVPLLLSGARHRWRAAGGGALMLAGSLCERFAVFHAGRQSARDPLATVKPQRARRTATS